MIIPMTKSLIILHHTSSSFNYSGNELSLCFKIMIFISFLFLTIAGGSLAFSSLKDFFKRCINRNADADDIILVCLSLLIFITCLFALISVLIVNI